MKKSFRPLRTLIPSSIPQPILSICQVGNMVWTSFHDEIVCYSRKVKFEKMFSKNERNLIFFLYLAKMKGEKISEIKVENIHEDRVASVFASCFTGF